MDVSVVRVESKIQQKLFVKFPSVLYKDCSNWVPALESGEYDDFDSAKNGAFEYCEAERFLAYKDGKPVGRVAAIINRKANEFWKENVIRFSRFDTVDDEEVAMSLLSAVEKWGRERGCNIAKGPWGFTNLDKEGLLVDGFEYPSPFTCSYNYPYYDNLLTKAGYCKDVDWTQKIVHIPAQLPKIYKYAETVAERDGLHMCKISSSKEFAKKYGKEIFRLYNESFSQIIQFCPVSDKQIQQYVDTYVPLLPSEYISVCLNDKDKPVGFAFCVPNLSFAVRRCKGRLYPFGFLHILNALKHNDTLEALLIGILPEYQSSGAGMLMFKQLHENCIRNGVTRLILNPQLEDNVKAQTLFSRYKTEPYMRRRAYRKEI